MIFSRIYRTPQKDMWTLPRFRSQILQTPLPPKVHPKWFRSPWLNRMCFKVQLQSHICIPLNPMMQIIWTQPLIVYEPWLVVWNMNFVFFIQLGMSPSQLTSIFFILFIGISAIRYWGQTTNQKRLRSLVCLGSPEVRYDFGEFLRILDADTAAKEAGDEHQEGPPKWEQPLKLGKL